MEHAAGRFFESRSRDIDRAGRFARIVFYAVGGKRGVKSVAYDYTRAFYGKRGAPDLNVTAAVVYNISAGFAVEGAVIYLYVSVLLNFYCRLLAVDIHIVALVFTTEVLVSRAYKSAAADNNVRAAVGGKGGAAVNAPGVAVIVARKEVYVSSLALDNVSRRAVQFLCFAGNVCTAVNS